MSSSLFCKFTVENKMDINGRNYSPEMPHWAHELLQNEVLGLGTVAESPAVVGEVILQVEVANLLIEDVLLVEEEDHRGLSQPRVLQDCREQRHGLL